MTVKTEVSTSVMRSSVLSRLGQSRARVPAVGTLMIDALVLLLELLDEAEAAAMVPVEGDAVVVTVIVLMVVPLLLLLASLDGYQHRCRSTVITPILACHNPKLTSSPKKSLIIRCIQNMYHSIAPHKLTSSHYLPPSFPRLHPQSPPRE